jgi:carboxypeptidase Q
MVRTLLPAAVALTCTFLAAADSEALRLVQRANGETPLARDLGELCDGIGGRPTGSDACSRAVTWALKKFREAGFDNARLEPFTVPALWLGVSAEAAGLQPAAFPVRLAAAPFTASTNGVVEANVVDAGEGTPADFSRIASSARGAIVLVHSNEMKSFDDLFAEYLRNGDLLAGAHKVGAAALLLESTRLRGLLYRHPMNGNGSLDSMPGAVVSREHAERIGRLLKAGPVRMRLRLTNRTGGAYTSNNVVAEIRGRERPDEVVLLGAHLDSWDLGTGAEDNGVNSAMVLDIARGFRELGIQPRRTIRFVLFTGEEQGMWGSAGYVARHRKELDNHLAAVIADTGSGHLSGFFLNGRDELRKPIDDALAAAGLSAGAHLTDALDGTDNFDFLLSGVPNLVAIQDPGPYLADYHAESDVPERSNIAEEKNTAAVLSALLYHLANLADRPAARHTRGEVEQLLLRTKLDQQMRAFGQWDDWAAGRRGLF